MFKNLIKGDNNIMETYKYIQGDTGTATVLFLVFMILTSLTLAYFILQEYLIGQTIGKILFRLKIVTVVDDETLGPINFWQSIVRSLFLIPTIPFILMWIIDPVYLLFTKKGQRLSEWLCKTKVIEVFQL